MTAEEYIETRRCKDSISNKFDMCYMDAALNAIKMAREEEREKAIKALGIALMAIIAKGDNKVSFGDIRDRFDRLLDQ